MTISRILLAIATVVVASAYPISAMAADAEPALDASQYLQLETRQAAPQNTSLILSNMDLDTSASRMSEGLRLSQEYRCVRRAALVTCFR